MAIDIKVNDKQVNNIKKRLKRVGKSATNRRIMNTVLLKVKNNIILRTNSGKDVNMSPFLPYNPNYASEEGKTIVNLTRTGTMLGAMTQKVINNRKGKIFFINSGYKDSNTTVHDLVRYHNQGDGVPKREFFGASSIDNKLAVSEYQKAVYKAIKGNA